MSQRNPGGLISGLPLTISSAGTSGIFTLSQAQQYISAGRWPINFYAVVMQFTGSGVWTCPTGVTSVDYLVVAGGGGARVGGGGAGGYRTGTGFPVTAGVSYTVTVGAGGSGSAPSPLFQAGSGGTSTWGNAPNAVSSTGGGGGGGVGFCCSNNPGAAGGSGGGGSRFASGGAGTPGQGKNGSTGSSNAGGGGGGAGFAATNAGTPTVEVGGKGLNTLRQDFYDQAAGAYTRNPQPVISAYDIALSGGEPYATWK
jgi:hypothetical protein